MSSNKEFSPTPSQQKAINARGETVLVSAGAGSGKTTLLVSRVIERLKEDENVNIDDFVIITFTKAAASELKGKLIEKINEASCKDPSNSHLRLQKALCAQSKIGTIHSFCGQLLRQYSKEAGISPDFKIVSDEKRNAIRSRCLEKLLDSCYENITEVQGFEMLVNTVGIGRDDKALFDLILTLHENMISHPDIGLWAEKVSSLYDIDAEDVAETPWGRDILSEISSRLIGYTESYRDYIETMSCDEVLEKKYVPSFYITLAGLESAVSACNNGWDEARSTLSAIEFPKLLSCSGTEMPEVAENAKNLKGKCSEYIKKASKSLVLDSHQLLADMTASAPAMKALLKVTLDFDKMFRAEKLRLDLLDYSDLEHYTFEMLEKNPDLKSCLSARYAEIMVDEYQDVNAIQDAIFNALSDNGKKLFMVGDVKQSIYRFRLADPSIFIKKSQICPPIALTDNFRSRKEVIDFINYVFERCMSPELGDVKYDENAALLCRAKYEGTVPEPELIIYKRSEDEEKHSFEASKVARMILKLSSEGYRFGDMAILLRSISESAPVYREELQKLGIPADTSQGSSFFTQNEVCEIIDILKIIDNPNNDISLISSLRTSGFTPDELTAIRTADTEHSMYHSLTLSCDEKCLAYLEKLKSWRSLARRMTMDQLLLSIGWPKSSNLLRLVDFAVNFESDGYHGIHHFVRYLDRLKESSLETNEENLKADAVHIMTIHKSKGLEFPVVFLCDTYHQFNFSDTRNTVLVHPELGLGPKYYDTAQKISYPTLARTAIVSRTRAETKSEEMRLLYVALTRAKERLIITASPVREIKEPLSPSDASTPLEWLIYSGIKPTTVEYGEDLNLGYVENEIPTGNYSSMPVIQYAHEEAVKIPASVSATEYKNYFPASISETSKERFFRKPDFSADTSAVKATDRGSAMHKVLQYMDLSKPVDEEIKRLLEKNYISPKDADIVDMAKLNQFLSSPLGMRIKSSPSVRREFNFLVLTDSSELLNTSVSEEVLLNGIVDCCFEEDGEIVIVDYKTDKVDRSEQYAPQIKAYAIALSKIFGKKIKEAYIYYLNLGYEKRIAV